MPWTLNPTRNPQPETRNPESECAWSRKYAFQCKFSGADTGATTEQPPPAYACPMRCAVLTYVMALPAVCGTDIRMALPG
eukprot:2013678-Rhodomonas_salina.1